MFTEDRSAFLDVAEFADSATLDSVAVEGIYDGPYSQPLGNLVDGSSRTWLMDSDRAAGAANGSDLIITTGHGVGTYKVRGVEPDGTGFTVLRLELQ